MLNLSEGRDPSLLGNLAAAGGTAFLDLHADPDHHRSVLTLAGPLGSVEQATHSVVTAAVERIDIGTHDGVHPRFGAVDVVPVVPLGPDDAAWTAAVSARDRLARWIGSELAVPCFLYGPERTLPDVRRLAFRGLEPDTGPSVPHPTAGATAVGVRRPLIAYNLWLEPARGQGGASVDVVGVSRELAAALRTSRVRALGLPVRGGAQVSCNLLEASGHDLERVFDAVARGAADRGCRLSRGEVVGLVPTSCLDEIPRRRWGELGVREDGTIEARYLERLVAGRDRRAPADERHSGPGAT